MGMGSLLNLLNISKISKIGKEIHVTKIANFWTPGVKGLCYFLKVFIYESLPDYTQNIKNILFYYIVLTYC